MSTWTNPRTWVTSEVVTAAQLNTHVRDNENFLNDFHGCRAYKSAAQTVASGNTDVITFNTEDYDTDALHNTGANTSRFVVPTGMGGYWRALCYVDIDADAGSHIRWVLSLRLNAAGASGGGTALDAHGHAGHALAISGQLEWIGPLAVGDYVEAFFNSAGEARDLTSGTSGGTTMIFHRMGG